MALRGMDAKALIKATGLSRAGVYFVLDGTTKPDTIRDATVTKFCRALSISREWMKHGRGPMEDAADSESGWADVRGYSQAVGLGKGAEAQEYAETHKLKFKASSLTKKRLNPAKLSVMYGQGDSMEPRIHDGDAVLFDTSATTPKDGALFVIQFHGNAHPEFYVKRCEVLDGIVFFRSDNPKGDHGWTKPRRMDDAKKPIEIIGRVRWIGSWED